MMNINKHKHSISSAFLLYHLIPFGNFEGSGIWHGIFLGVNFWSRDFFGFCWKP